MFDKEKMLDEETMGDVRFVVEEKESIKRGRRWRRRKPAAARDSPTLSDFSCPRTPGETLRYGTVVSCPPALGIDLRTFYVTDYNIVIHVSFCRFCFVFMKQKLISKPPPPLPPVQNKIKGTKEVKKKKECRVPSSINKQLNWRVRVRS